MRPESEIGLSCYVSQSNEANWERPSGHNGNIIQCSANPFANPIGNS